MCKAHGFVSFQSAFVTTAGSCARADGRSPTIRFLFCSYPYALCLPPYKKVTVLLPTGSSTEKRKWEDNNFIMWIFIFSCREQKGRWGVKGNPSEGKPQRQGKGKRMKDGETRILSGHCLTNKTNRASSSFRASRSLPLVPTTIQIQT